MIGPPLVRESAPFPKTNLSPADSMWLPRWFSIQLQVFCDLRRGPRSGGHPQLELTKGGAEVEMTQSGGLTVTSYLTRMLLIAALLPDCIWAGPVLQCPEGEDAGDTASTGESTQLAAPIKLAHNSRSAQLTDFWAWYKFFMDSGNQRERYEQIYKSCAESEDPDCITEYTSKPRA
ncbi:hypothetical protein GN956_G13084 [Arapaima gigas]